MLLYLVHGSLRVKKKRNQLYLKFPSTFNKHQFFSFKDYQPQLDLVKGLCANDMHVGTNPLMRKLYEIEARFVAPIENFDVLNSPDLWRYRQPLSISHMRMKLQGKYTQSEGKENRQIYQFLEDVSFPFNLIVYE